MEFLSFSKNHITPFTSLKKKDDFDEDNHDQQPKK